MATIKADASENAKSGVSMKPKNDMGIKDKPASNKKKKRRVFGKY